MSAVLDALALKTHVHCSLSLQASAYFCAGFLEHERHVQTFLMPVACHACVGRSSNAVEVHEHVYGMRQLAIDASDVGSWH